MVAVQIQPKNNVHQRSKDYTNHEVEDLRKRINERLNQFPVSCIEFVVLEDEKCVGNAGIYNIKEDESAVVGLVIDHTAWGKGLGQLITKMLVQLSFDLGLKRVDIGTMKSNLAMRKVIEKIGGKEYENIVDIPGRGIFYLKFESKHLAGKLRMCRRSGWSGSSLDERRLDRNSITDKFYQLKFKSK